LFFYRETDAGVVFQDAKLLLLVGHVVEGRAQHVVHQLVDALVPHAARFASVLFQTRLEKTKLGTTSAKLGKTR